MISLHGRPSSNRKAAGTPRQVVPFGSGQTATMTMTMRMGAAIAVLASVSWCVETLAQDAPATIESRDLQMVLRRPRRRGKPGG